MQALAQLFISCIVERYKGRILLSFKQLWIIKCKDVSKLNLCNNTLTCNQKNTFAFVAWSISVISGVF